MRYLFIFICAVLIWLPTTIDASPIIDSNAPFQCDGSESTRSIEYKNCFHMMHQRACFDEIDRMYGPYSPEGHRMIKVRIETSVKRHGYGTSWHYRVGNSIRGLDVTCYTEDGIFFSVTPEPAWIADSQQPK